MESWFLFVRIIVNPIKPVSSFCNILDHYEIVAPDKRPFNPEFESLILKLENVIKLDLINPVHVASHVLHVVLRLSIPSITAYTTLILPIIPFRRHH